MDVQIHGASRSGRSDELWIAAPAVQILAGGSLPVGKGGLIGRIEETCESSRAVGEEDVVVGGEASGVRRRSDDGDRVILTCP
jgi:hypothetical protein